MSQARVDSKELRKLLNHYTLLYVEDNAGLKAKASTLFRKLFPKVIEAKDGEEGLELFKKHKPEFVITDIQMPKMNGIEMAEEIQKLEPKTKIIITTAYDEKSYLLKSIELKVEGYLIKPIQVDALTSLFFKVAQQMHEARQKEVFNNYLYSIFNHQDNFIIMLKGQDVVLVNEHVLEFFSSKNTAEFREKFKSFNSMLASHDTFLYPQSSSDICLERVKKDIDKLYNVKIYDKEETPHHFLLKLTHISDKEDFYILSLTDITELNLLALYDENSLEHDKAMKDEKTIYNLLQAARDGGAVVKIYNFYKGLTVCNNGVFSKVEKESSVLKTSAMQLKAAKLEKKTILHCEIFPYDLQADELVSVNFKEQSMEIGKCKMLKTTPSQRKYLILKPDDKHSLTLFYEKRKFDTKAHVVDISKESAKVHLAYLPAGMKEGDELVLDMVFNDTIKPYIINTSSTVFKIIPIEKEFDVICTFNMKTNIQKNLVEYLASRQMKLVKEFKSLKI